MKSKLWSLFKYTTLNNFKLGKNLKIKMVPQNIVQIIICILLLGVILAYSTLYSYIAYQGLNAYNLKEYLPALFYIITVAISFMFTIYKAKGMLFDSYDNDMLFAMPIKFRTILSNRILTLLSTNYLFSILAFVPSVILYAVFTPVSIMYFINAFVVLLFLPLIPTVIASLIGYIVAYITSRFGSKKIIELILTFVMFFGIFICSNILSSKLVGMVNNIDKINDLFGKYGFIVYYVKDTIINGNILSLILYVFLNIITFGLFVYIFAKEYKVIISRLSVTRTSSKKVELKYSSKSSIKSALLRKEFKRYFSSPIYVFNTAFGVISLLLLTIYVIFIQRDILTQMMQGEGVLLPMYGLVVCITAFIVSMSNTTCSAISLEGKNLWLTKSLPVSTKDIFNSKILLNIIVVLPITLICIALLAIAMKFTLIQVLINIVIVTILTIFVSQFGLIINLKYPKLNFISDTQVVKQSTATLIAILAPMVFVMIAVYVFNIISQYINLEMYSLIVSLVFAGICLIQNRILNSYGVKRFNEL